MLLHVSGIQDLSNLDLSRLVLLKAEVPIKTRIP